MSEYIFVLCCIYACILEFSVIVMDCRQLALYGTVLNCFREGDLGSEEMRNDHSQHNGPGQTSARIFPKYYY